MEKKSPKPFYSRKVSTPTRVYYFDAYFDKRGVAYAKITEQSTNLSPNKHKGTIVVHREISNDFYLALIDLFSPTAFPVRTASLFFNVASLLKAITPSKFNSF